MNLSLKNKLVLGFGFLFFMILLIWIIGVFFIYDLSNRSAAMLKENYQSVESSKHLIQSLDKIKDQQTKYFLSNAFLYHENEYTTYVSHFKQNLTNVEANITEIGEKELIKTLEESAFSYFETFDSLKRIEEHQNHLYFTLILPLHQKTKQHVVELWEINMDAISHKNGLLKNTAHRAFLIISFIGTVCIIISSLVFFRYPKSISKPIQLLTKGIKEISKKNYELRIKYDANDEFGELANAFNTMAAKLDEYEHSNLSELVFEKKRIDTIINTMNDAIIGLNEKNIIIFSNTIACLLLDLEAGDIVGMRAPELAENNQIFKQIFSTISSTQHKTKEFDPLRLVVGLKTTYFTREILDVNLSITGENKSVNVGKVIILKNITKFLEQNEAKTNFIATISHELKTPLSSLKLNLKLLKDKRIGTLNEEQYDILNAFDFEVKKMLKITSELLDLAQVETGNIKFNIKRIHPIDVIEYTKNTSVQSANFKQINIHYEIEQKLPLILADLERSSWVLLNIISNAIHYSPVKSKIIVQVQNDNDGVVFSVKDEGPGIENKYLTHIFDKFFRVPNSVASGTGLGLAISNEFIQKQNGRIWVESKINKGSTFSFILPHSL